MLRPVTSEAELHQMARESAGLHGSGVLAFRLVGSGYGGDLFLAAWRGDPLAQSLVAACLDYIGGVDSSPPGVVAVPYLRRPLHRPGRVAVGRSCPAARNHRGLSGGVPPAGACWRSRPRSGMRDGF